MAGLKIATAFSFCIFLASPGATAFAAEPPKAERAPAVDQYGDPLPAGTLARMGKIRFLHAGPVSRVVFAPDGKSLFSGSEDWTVRQWDLATGKEMRRFQLPVRETHPAGVVSIALSPDGKYLAAGIKRSGGTPIRRSGSGTWPVASCCTRRWRTSTARTTWPSRLTARLC